MIRETIQKKILCIMLSIAVAVTTFCCNQEVALAVGALQETGASTAEKSSSGQEENIRTKQGRLESENPGAESAGTEKSGAEKPESGAAETEKPESGAAETEKPESGTAESENPGAESAETEKPESESEKPESGAEKSESGAAESENPGAESAGTEESGAEKPESGTAGAEEPGTEVSETEENTSEAPNQQPSEPTEPEENTSDSKNHQASEPEDFKQENAQNPDDISQNSDTPVTPAQQNAAESVGAAIPADHTLSTVYWNPKAESETSPDGHTYLYGGNDGNTGASARVPVQTLETALLRAASDAVIYCMGYDGKYADYSADGGYYNATIKRYEGHTGNILQITNGTMKISNFNLDGSDSEQSPVLAVTSGGELILGDSVGNVGNTRYLIESAGKPVRLAGRPERGTVYHLRFASGYYNHAVSDPDSGLKEIMLADASEAGLDPTGYFAVEDLPEGWEVYTRNNRQIWARRIEPYTAVYLNGISGDDSSSGRSERQAVKTYARAWELYQSKLNGKGTIYITGTVQVSGSLSIEQVRIARGSFGGALFQVTDTGTFTVGTNVTIQDDPAKNYAIKSSGNLIVTATSDVAGVFLSNRTKPLTLEGTGSVKYHVSVGTKFQAGDLVVSNANTSQAKLSGEKYVLVQQGANLHLGYPPCIYLDGQNGNDYYPGDMPELGVKSLQKALTLAQSGGINKIMILGGPAQVQDGDTLTIPDGMEIRSYDDYGGDLINVSGGLLTVQGIVSSSALSSTGIVIQGNGKVIAGNGNVQIGGIVVKGNGTLDLGDVGIDRSVILPSGSPTVTQNGGMLHAGLSVQAGTYTLNEGSITDVDVSGSGAFHMKGGDIRQMENKAALTVTAGGTASISGGTIEEFTDHAIVIKDADVTLSGGVIQGKENAKEPAVKAEGTLHIAGEADLKNAVIRLEDNTHPLLLETTLPADRVYQIDVGYSYVAPRDSEVLVQGAADTPATAEHFQMAPGTGTELSLENDDAAYCVKITKAGDPEGVYLDGAHGNDANTGEDSVRAVQTFAKAKELLRRQYEDNHKEYDIIMSGNVTVTGNETWSLPESEFPWHPVVKRYGRWKDDASSSAYASWHVYGMVHVSGNLTLENITLDGNKDVESCYSVIYTSRTVNINSGAVITGNNKIKSVGGGAYDSGAGGITANSNMSHINLNGGSIRNNYSKAAGGVSVGSGSFVMNSGSIEYNVSEGTYHGGGIEAVPMIDGAGEIIINGGEISHNKSADRGGGILVQSINNFTINGGTISYNEAKNGGGISNDARMRLKISGGEISHNKASENGGGIESTKLTSGFYEYYSVELTGGTITQNEAGKKGGGVYWKEGNMLLDGIEISGNKADLGGGAYIEELLEDDTYTFEIKSGSILGNKAVSKGGGIFWATGRNVTFSGGTVADNEAPKGEGIFLEKDSHSVAGYPRIYGSAAFGSSRIMQNIKLGDDSSAFNKLIPIRLITAPADPDSHFNLEVAGSAYARSGAVVVEPDGDNVTNAAQYLKNFSLNDSSGYTLVKSGNNIILGQAYFVDGVNGSDSNSGVNPDSAFKTVSHAISALGVQAGAIYICGTVSVPSSGTPGASPQVTWTLRENQSIIRYSGELAGGRTYEPFTGNMIEVKDGAELTLNNAKVYGALGEESAGGNGYLLVQGGTLKVSPDTSLEYGTVYLKDTKEITVTGDGSALLMEVEKENAREGDVIGHYIDAGAGKAKEENFRLSEEMGAFSLHKRDADTVVLGAVGKVYVDGQNGNDGRDGTTPATAFLTMKKAYQALQASGGQIYIVDTVELSGETELGNLRYKDTDGVVNMTGRVQIMRYEANKNPLFLVSAKTTVLSGILLDGAGAAAAGNTSALVKVGAGGTLKIRDHAVLKNNQSAGNGGAIENEGTVELYECSFRQNQAAKGSAVYQKGVLSVNSGDISWSEAGGEKEEIYLCEDKYIGIQKSLSADTELRINMDPGDTDEGRVVAEFAKGAYDETGVIQETGHFWIDPAATRRGLAAGSEATLVLAGDFDATLTGTEFFQEIGKNISLNSMFQNAVPEDVTVKVTKNGHEIPVETRDYNRYKKVIVPVSREHVGELTFTFCYGSAEVEKKVVLSGYEVVYAQGQDSLVAKAQKDNVSGIHTDQARIRIYNGASVQKEFHAGERSIQFEDRAWVEIDNSRVSRDMEPDLAMRYFGLDLDETLQVPANGTAEVLAVLSNGDLLTADKKGSIMLDNASLGGSSSNIGLAYRTEAVVRVQVQVRKDDISTSAAAVVLRDASGQMIGMSAGTGAWPYRATGISPGTYRLYVEGKDTGKTVTARAGLPVQEEIDLYTIRYELKGGKFKNPAPEYYISGVGIDALAQPSYSGHTFGGWYQNASYTGHVTAGISKEAAAPYVLYAKWEKTPIDPEPDPEPPAFKVLLQQDAFFQQLGSTVTVKGQLVNAQADEVKVTVQKAGADGKARKTIAAECSDAEGIKTVMFPLSRESVGTLILTFQKGEEKIMLQAEVSGYEVEYREGQDSLTAKPQKDGKEEIHKDTAQVMIHNGALTDREFSIGGSEIGYKDGSRAKIDKAKVSQNMKMEDAMRYFGLEVESFQSIGAGESKAVKVTLSNGDLLSADKKGTIVLTDAVLGNCRADIGLAYETQAITRVQIRVQKDDVPVKNAEITLKGQSGNAISVKPRAVGSKDDVNQKAASSKDGADQKAASSKDGADQKADSSKDGIYQKTGISTETYHIYVNGVDTGKQIQAERGKVSKRNVNFYSIRYQLNQGTVEESLPDYYVQGIGAALTDPMRAGYTFEGWYQTKDFSGEALKEVSKKASGSLKLYAKWKEELKITASTSAPKTGDGSIIAIDVALMGGMGYLMKMFTSADLGMDEEQKQELLRKMIGRAKGKNLLVRLGTIALIAISLLLYYTVGMKKAVRRARKIQRRQNI